MADINKFEAIPERLIVGVVAKLFEKSAVMVVTLVFDTILSVSVTERITEINGQVPHTGLLASVSAELSEKKSGSVVISVTHQPDKSWLNEVVFLNTPFILFSASP